MKFGTQCGWRHSLARGLGRALCVKKPERPVDHGDGPALLGYAALWKRPFSDSGGQWQVFWNGCFATDLRKGRPVDFLEDHNWSRPVAGTEDGSLLVWEDAIGLAIEVRPHGSQAFTSLYERVRAGKIAELSVGFRRRHTTTETGSSNSCLIHWRGELHEISAVEAGAAEGVVLVAGQSTEHAPFPSYDVMEMNHAAAQVQSRLARLREVVDVAVNTGSEVEAVRV